jgi:nuclear pore complex protein Nup155
MVKVVGSQTGRIFMAGSNGNMYELDYKSSESAWATVFGSGQTHKCQKINHSAWNWKLVDLVPPFLRTILDVNDSLVDLIMDDMRNVLYTVSLRGILSAFYLGADSKAVSPPIVREFDIFQEVQKFLSYQMVPESSPRESVFRDTRSMSIAGVFIIPFTESRKVHTVVMLNNGIRIYLRLIGSDRLPFTSAVGSRGNIVPVGVQIVYVRNPPSPDAIR